MTPERSPSTNSRTVDQSAHEEVREALIMDEDKILPILGDLAGYKDQLDDCLETDVSKLRTLPELDELKKEVKQLKADIQKSVSKLEYLNKEPGKVAEFKVLVDRGKKFITTIDTRKQKVTEELSKNNDEETFSRVRILHSSLELAFKRCVAKVSVDCKSVADGELIMLSDNISGIRDEFIDLNKLYFDFVEKCPSNFPDRDVLFLEYKNKMKDTEEKKIEYEAAIMKEMHERELTRNKIQDTKNEIKLALFKGYGSELDYYSFKSQFINKYRRYTSRDKVDILKNTYLKGEAFNTVKELRTLDEIWVRLKEEFGNPSRMLKNKLLEILAINPVPRTRKVRERSEAVLKIINLLTDAFKLAEDHDLQLELYCKNEKVLGQLLKQLPPLWLHDWHALKKSSKEELATKTVDAPAWMSDRLKWELYKQFLTEQLANLKEEELMDDALKDISLEDPKNKIKDKDKDVPKSTFTSDRTCTSDELECECDDFYDYEDFSEDKSCHVVNSGVVELPCKLCKGPTHKHYWDCQKFMEMKHAERFELFINPKKNMNPKPHVGNLLGECAACLVPNTKFPHNCHENEEVKKWLCTESHQRPVHILCCKHHTNKNKNIWEQFQYNTKVGFVQDEVIPTWKREMKWMAHFVSPTRSSEDVKPKPTDLEHSKIEPPVREEGLFLFQKIVVDGEVYNVFFDDGCGDFCVNKSAVDRLGPRATQTRKGPIQITGVGNTKTESRYGEYQVQLPLINGYDARFVGLCFDEVTAKFCEYDTRALYSKVVDDFVKGGGDKNSLPTVSNSGLCGGETNLMIGMKYNRYQPRLIHKLESGLAVYESVFRGEDGSNAVIGGPDPLVTQMELEWSRRNNGFTNYTIQSYYSSQLQTYLDGIDIFPDSRFRSQALSLESYSGKTYKEFQKIEEVGTVMSYRCPKCQRCKDCLCGPAVEEISRKEECEQQIINESVRFCADEGKVRCALPLLQDPSKVLGKNEKNARKIYQRWVAKLNQNSTDRDSAIRSHDKLKTRGHVATLKELTDEQRKIIDGSPARYFLPWRPVYNENSLSTPCRITWDGSDKTDTGVSLNDILPKGINLINNLAIVVMQWRNGTYALTGDFEQMYNGLLLDEEFWSMQQYYWHPTLKEGAEPEVYVVKTATYGVRSSGNQAITGVRLVAEHSKDEFPEVHNVFTKQIYVDDLLPKAKPKLELLYELADQMVVVAARGGLKLKSFAFSSIPPDRSISSNGITVDVAGMKWNTVTDQLGLKLGMLNFAKRYRGKKPTNPECYKIPSNITRRICTSKVGELWDLLGMLVPITARLKLDLHELVVSRKLKWDETIPEDLRKIWVENFELINKLDGIKFSRATVPMDAVSLDMETIEAGDASSVLICAAVYVRFKRKNGMYSCELVIGKSKLVPSGMTIPRAELYAAEVNTALGQMAHRAFGAQIIQRYKITDSKVAYYWIHSWEKPLKLWTRNRVNEVLRGSKLEDWYLGPGNVMPCDIGTRRLNTITEISQYIGNGSKWKGGAFPWMVDSPLNFPLKTFADIKLEEAERVAYEKEIVVQAKGFVANNKKCPSKQISEKIRMRLQFSNYLVHPNKYRFKSSVRILGIVIEFVLKLSRRLKRSLFITNEKEEIEYKFKYFHVSHYNEQSETKVGMSGLLYEKIHSVNVSKTETPTEQLQLVVLSERAIHLSLRYFYQKATKEVEKFSGNSKVVKQSVLVGGIRFWNGRLLASQQFTSPKLHPISSAMLDLSSTSFCVPIVDQFSPVAWSMIHEIHWYHDFGKHSGVATTARIAKEYAYIIGVKEIAELFRKLCGKCRWIAKRTVDAGFGPLSDHQLKLAPAFYATQVDLMGPFKAYQINVRATLKIWFAVFVCVVTSTVNIQVMECYSSGSFISAFIRFVSHNGYPKILLPDQGQNIESALRNVEIDWTDVKGRLHKSYGVEVETCGVGGHHQHGKVERKIRQIKETFLKSFKNVRISVLQWQTVADETTNSINNLPIGTGSSRNVNLELDDLDIITPNRLRFGRNNERAPLGPAYISNDPFKFMDVNQEIYEAWWEHWLTSAAPELIEKPVHWKRGDNLKEGDIVLFRKAEGAVGAGTYQYGMVQSVLPTKDDAVRNVMVKYRNWEEQQDRLTKRSVKALILIHQVNELNIMKEMADASQYVDELFHKAEGPSGK